MGRQAGFMLYLPSQIFEAKSCAAVGKCVEFISKANHLDDRYGCDCSCVSARKAFDVVLWTFFNRRSFGFWKQIPPSLICSWWWCSLLIELCVYSHLWLCWGVSVPGSGTAQLKGMLWWQQFPQLHLCCCAQHESTLVWLPLVHRWPFKMCFNSWQISKYFQLTASLQIPILGNGSQHFHNHVWSFTQP